jgi:hypothetical protein
LTQINGLANFGPQCRQSMTLWLSIEPLVEQYRQAVNAGNRNRALELMTQGDRLYQQGQQISRTQRPVYQRLLQVYGNWMREFGESSPKGLLTSAIQRQAAVCVVQLDCFEQHFGDLFPRPPEE